VIVCKKLKLYDVDLIGLGVLVAFGVAAWWLVVVPWQRTWTGYQDMAAQQAEMEHRLQDEIVTLEQRQQELVQLEEVIEAEVGGVPHAGTLSGLLQEITDMAREANLDLLSVAPKPAAASGAYLVSDVQMGGRGCSHDFIRFLDCLAQRNPYQVLHDCSITSSPMGPGLSCELGWTVRLYLLPDPSSRDEGESS